MLLRLPSPSQAAAAVDAPPLDPPPADAATKAKGGQASDQGAQPEGEGEGEGEGDDPFEAWPAPERELRVQLVGCFEGWSLITIACNHEPTWMVSELARVLGFETPLSLLAVLAERWYDRCPSNALHYVEHGDRRELLARLDRAHVVLAPERRRKPIVLLGAVAVYELVSALDSAHARRLARHLREQVIPEFHAHERAARALERPLLSIDAVTIAGNRLEFEQRCFEAAVLERLLDRLEHAGAIDGDQLVAHRVVATEIALGARLQEFSEALAHGWMTPTQVAERWCDMTPLRVGRLIAHLGLKGSRAHSRAFISKARGHRRTVISYVYSPAAVALIERELRARGQRRCTCAEDMESMTELGGVGGIQP